MEQTSGMFVQSCVQIFDTVFGVYIKKGIIRL